MYGRPEGSAFSCLRAFDNSIIPIRSDLRVEGFLWPDPELFFSPSLYESLKREHF